jgi:hypothetical protein
MINDPLRIVVLPGLAWMAGGAVLVETNEQICQLASDGIGAEQGGQLGQGYEPVGVPARPVVVGAIDNPEDAMMSLTSLMQQLADLAV